jgi:hypothetical protein
MEVLPTITQEHYKAMNYDDQHQYWQEKLMPILEEAKQALFGTIETEETKLAEVFISVTVMHNCSKHSVRLQTDEAMAKDLENKCYEAIRNIKK